MLDPSRIMQRCDALARHSELPGGLTRVFLSPEGRAASDAVLGWMREAGMNAHLDAIGNAVGRYEGERAGLPCLMFGSHLDTVRDGGRYDGMLGVITAIECVDFLNSRKKRMPFAIEVIGFGATRSRAPPNACSPSRRSPRGIPSSSRPWGASR